MISFVAQSMLRTSNVFHLSHENQIHKPMDSFRELELCGLGRLREREEDREESVNVEAAQVFRDACSPTEPPGTSWHAGGKAVERCGVCSARHQPLRRERQRSALPVYGLGLATRWLRLAIALHRDSWSVIRECRSGFRPRASGFRTQAR